MLESFFLLTDPNVRIVVLGCILLCGMSAVVGCFTFLRKRALIGDAVSHSVLPGICLSYIISGEKNPLILMIGAIVTGLLSMLIMEALSRSRKTRPDTALALMLSVFFGAGIVLMTHIQHSGSAGQAGLDKFLFGKAASITSEDLKLIFISSGIIVLSLVVLRRGFYLISFDEDYANVTGFPVRLLRFVLAFLTVWAVAVGIQAVGVVLMAALLVTPALSARFWTNSLQKMMLIAGICGLLSGYAGAFVSFLAPAMPTGPWIVVMASTIAAFSMLFAPGKGLLSRFRIHRRNQLKTLEENILKEFFHLHEKAGKTLPVLEEDLLNQRAIPAGRLRRGLNSLMRKGFLEYNLHAYQLTEKGVTESRRVVRLHRLWELYLQRYLHLDPDHVHDDAEAIEHVITPEIEAKLDQDLGYPHIDPHNTMIPRQ